MSGSFGMNVKKMLGILYITSALVLSKDYKNELEFFLTKKEIHSTENLVNNAIKYAHDHTIYDTCISLKHDTQWQYPNTEIIIFDEENIIWLCTCQGSYIWDKQQLKTLKTADLIPVTQIANEKGAFGVWVPFLVYQGNIANAYFKNFTKNGKRFTLGALVFPMNNLHEAAKMVLKASDYLKENGLYQLIDATNRLVGPFIQGNLSISIYNNLGINIADSYDMTRVGIGSDFWVDDDKKNVFDTYKKATDNERGFGWATNRFKGQEKNTLILKAIAGTIPQEIYISSGYYPLTDTTIENLANKTKKLLQKVGVALFDEPSQVTAETHSARLNIVIYDDKGTVQLHTRYPALRGINLINHIDHAGNYITKEITEKALKDGSGWIFSYIFNAIQPIYLEKITLPEGTFIITIQGYTPIDKKNIIASRAEIIGKYLLNHTFKNTMRALNGMDQEENIPFQSWQHGGFFYRIYDKSGFCVNAGIHYNKIWDKADKEIFTFLNQLETNKKGGDWFSYKRKNKKFNIYVKRITKSPTEKYIIVVGYSSAITKGK